jgi:predicted transcriptional regulator of viral defense system
LQLADAYATTLQGFTVRVVASPEQAMVDAAAEPAWMTNSSLLPEILTALWDAKLERSATRALERSTAAAQCLGYLLEGAGRELPPALTTLRPVRAVRLRPGQASSGRYSSRWRIYG